MATATAAAETADRIKNRIAALAAARGIDPTALAKSTPRLPHPYPRPTTPRRTDRETPPPGQPKPTPTSNTATRWQRAIHATPIPTADAINTAKEYCHTEQQRQFSNAARLRTAELIRRALIDHTGEQWTTQHKFSDEYTHTTYLQHTASGLIIRMSLKREGYSTAGKMFLHFSIPTQRGSRINTAASRSAASIAADIARRLATREAIDRHTETAKQARERKENENRINQTLGTMARHLRARIGNPTDCQRRATAVCLPWECDQINIEIKNDYSLQINIDTRSRPMAERLAAAIGRELDQIEKDAAEEQHREQTKLELASGSCDETNREQE